MMFHWTVSPFLSCSCVSGVCRRREPGRWPIYFWLPQTACWRPDSCCCSVSHWHHHPAQWPLQVQVQPGQEKEDRKQCSADALRPRSFLWLLDVRRPEHNADFPTLQPTDNTEQQRDLIHPTRGFCFIVRGRQEVVCVYLRWGVTLSARQLSFWSAACTFTHAHTRTYTHTCTLFLSLSCQSIELVLVLRS